MIEKKTQCSPHVIEARSWICLFENCSLEHVVLKNVFMVGENIVWSGLFPKLSKKHPMRSLVMYTASHHGPQPDSIWTKPSLRTFTRLTRYPRLKCQEVLRRGGGGYCHDLCLNLSVYFHALFWFCFATFWRSLSGLSLVCSYLLI